MHGKREMKFQLRKYYELLPSYIYCSLNLGIFNLKYLVSSLFLRTILFFYSTLCNYPISGHGVSYSLIQLQGMCHINIFNILINCMFITLVLRLPQLRVKCIKSKIEKPWLQLVPRPKKLLYCDWGGTDSLCRVYSNDSRGSWPQVSNISPTHTHRVNACHYSIISLVLEGFLAF